MKLGTTLQTQTMKRMQNMTVKFVFEVIATIIETGEGLSPSAQYSCHMLQVHCYEFILGISRLQHTTTTGWIADLLSTKLRNSWQWACQVTSKC